MPDLAVPTARPLTGEQIVRTRRSMAAASVDVAVAPGTRLTASSIARRPALWVRPEAGPAVGTIVLLHGGGFRAGSPAGVRGVASYLAARGKVEVVSPAYRLAPEAPFPAAIDDVVRVLAALAVRRVPAARTVVVGLSAGGGLALSGLLAAARAGLEPPAAAVGVSAWIDLTATAGSYDRCAATDAIISRTSSLQSAHVYLAGNDPRDPLASPVFADDRELAALPPVALHVGAGEVLLDDSRRFAERLRGAGGSCDLEVWPGVAHCWPMDVPDRPEALAVIDRISKILES